MMTRPDFLPDGFGTVARAGFQEVWVPEPVSMLPQTVGWWVILGIGFLALSYSVYRRILRFRADAYRREALKDLAALRLTLSSNKNRAEALPTLLKQAALGGYPRRQVAGLSGDRWGAFLMKTAPQSFDDRTVSFLHELSYRGADRLSAADIATTADAIESWIRRHRAAV
jgi:hypothetical protein